jgi:hypothetical protein
MVRLPSAVDHLVYGVPDLEAGLAAVAARTGVKPQRGGRHPGAGTANALLALGPAVYLEIIGPDPEQADRPRWFGLAELRAPRLLGWAARVEGLAATLPALRAAHFDPGPLRDGSRRQANGDLLRWQLAFPAAGRLLEGGTLPFLIDWLASPHPAATAPAGCRLESLSATHPDPQRIAAMLATLDVALPVAAGPAALQAVIATPQGPWLLGPV